MKKKRYWQPNEIKRTLSTKTTKTEIKQKYLEEEISKKLLEWQKHKITKLN